MTKLRIFAGPCSIDRNNLKEIYEIADIKVVWKNGVPSYATFGTRIVGLKSRSKIYEKGDEYMGMDFEQYNENLEILARTGNTNEFKILPSIELAKQIIKDTGLVIWTEIMSTAVQLPLFNQHIPNGKLFIWNPAINQLGWPIYETSFLAKQNGWYMGIKNWKWLGREADWTSNMEKAWAWLANFATVNWNLPEKVCLIHRGVEVEDKGNFRSKVVHDCAERTKSASWVSLFFDPSHSFWPKLRDQIVEGTLTAMKMKTSTWVFLYDWLLLEVGTSKTDSGQHITVGEYKFLVEELSNFREIESRI